MVFREVPKDEKIEIYHEVGTNYEDKEVTEGDCRDNQT
jgi:hypothetical protein